jgi:hypothetical protein
MKKIKGVARMKKFRMLIILIIMTVGWLVYNVQPASAVPLVPSSFHGTVKLNGANVPAGTVIHAYINGVEYAHTTVLTYQGDTVYSLDVPSEDTDTPGTQGGVEGDKIDFYIGSKKVTQTGTWHSGTYISLNLYDPAFTTFLPLVRR